MQWTTNEFCIEWVKGDSTATVTAPEGSALNTRLTRLAEEYPEEVDVRNSELFHVPVKWVKVSPPPRRTYTEEQKQIARERMKALHNKSRKQS